jgi:hypothetical protein
MPRYGTEAPHVGISGRTSGASRARSARAVAPIAILAALALPASAAALPATSVVSASIDGPNAAMVSGQTYAACTPRLVSGGGARTDQAVLSNGTHLNATFPTPDGVGPSTNGDLSPTNWMGAGAIGGQATSGVTTWAYGICLDSGPGSTIVVKASKPGPSETFTGVLATATCPAGTRLLSGGAQTTPGTVGSLKPNGSFPSDESGNPVLSGGLNPTSWTAAGLNGGQPPASNTTHVYAVCATAGADNPTVMVRSGHVDGPGDASTGDQVTVGCPDGGVLLGGGGWISDEFGLPGSQGDHLTGSFPSDANGTPITSGAASAWTASSHIGGTVSGPKTDTDVWAMCAVEPAAGGGSDAPPKTGKTGPIAGGITTNQLLQSLRRQMTPRGSAAKIGTLLKKGGAKLSFKAMDAGKVVIRWSTVSVTVHGKKTKSILVAQGSKTFLRSGPGTVNVRLTTAGKRLLRRSKRVRLSARGTFTRKGKKAIVGTKAFVLTPKAASTEP